MAAEATIQISDLRKRFGPTTAVDGLSFTVSPGQVTGFVGPNGAGKSTTMRMILGLDAPDAGTALIGGLRYAALRHPLKHVGAMLDAAALHPARRARDHLLWLAHSHGLPARRVDEVIGLVGLESVARRRAGGYSMGMRQRLGIAAALLGDPATVILDEPVNGLDTEGIRWIRSLLQGLAAEGRTVFVSSHLMSEMALTAQHLIVIGRGRLIADTGMEEFVSRAEPGVVRVRSTDPAALAALLRSREVAVSEASDGALAVSGLSTDQVGRLAGGAGITLLELTAQQASLEEAFIDLTRDAVEFRAPMTGGAQP
jgi:ABC-2 type transport system ATP-binding protein